MSESVLQYRYKCVKTPPLFYLSVNGVLFPRGVPSPQKHKIKTMVSSKYLPFSSKYLHFGSDDNARFSLSHLFNLYNYHKNTK